MQVKILKVGMLRTNCYIVSNDDKCLIIDPGDDFKEIDNSLSNPIAILITHRHFDHIGALNELVSKYDIPVYDKSNLKEKEYKLNSFTFDVIFTPGHTDDCVTYYFKDNKMMFTGDFLFFETIGRTDLETSSLDDIKNSINKIKTYSADIIIYPGHGKDSSLGHEKKYNRFLTGELKVEDED